MNVAKKWYVVYTKPRWEKKVHALFVSKGYESYCPLNKVLRKWSDRMKKVEEPLFKSYVFVCVNEEEQTKVRMINGVLNFVYWLGKPAVIKQLEINNIKRFLDEYNDVYVEPIEIEPMQRVVVTSGVFMSSEGRVLRVSKYKVQVMLDSIGLRLVAYIDKKKVELIKT
jgi:transcription antitermination factor NusG